MRKAPCKNADQSNLQEAPVNPEGVREIIHPAPSRKQGGKFKVHCELLDSINRACQASISYGYQLPEQEVIPTGLPQLDAVIGGGVPRGRIVEIFGAEGSGKTALALHLAQQLPGPALYVDADGGLSPYILKGQDLYLLRLETLEDTLDACTAAARTGAFGSIVIDSVCALPTNEEMRNTINSKYWPEQGRRQAKVLSKALPILAGVLHYTGCTLVLVNQLRNKAPCLYGRPDHPTGGRAIAYYSSLRLETHGCGVIKEADTVTGQKILVRVEKCKYAPPGKRATASLLYGEGVCA